MASGQKKPVAGHCFYYDAWPGIVPVLKGLVGVLVPVAVLLIRAVMFKPHKEPKPSGGRIELDNDRIVNDMVQMIRCKTVSYNDESLIDKAEFKKFQGLLP